MTKIMNPYKNPGSKTYHYFMMAENERSSIHSWIYETIAALWNAVETEKIPKDFKRMVSDYVYVLMTHNSHHNLDYNMIVMTGVVARKLSDYHELCERFNKLFKADLDQYLAKDFTDGEVISLEDRYSKLSETEQHPIAKEAYSFAAKTLKLRTKYFGGFNMGNLSVINELDTASLSTDAIKFILGEDVGVPEYEWWGIKSPIFKTLFGDTGEGEADLIFGIWHRWSDEPRILLDELRLILEARKALV